MKEEDYEKKQNDEKMLASILMLGICFTYLNVANFIPEVKAAENLDTVKIFFVDNTSSKWVNNDSAVMEVVDNTNQHLCYTMNQQGENTWYAILPESAYNLTFNRMNADGTTQWNSWSAGGRDSNNTYYADGAEYGHWGYMEDTKNCFQKGDTVYLDLTEYTEWENAQAKMYLNGSSATKSENGGQDVTISTAQKMYYAPVVAENGTLEHIYKYTFTEDTAGITVLRFWRGNDTTLWNYSVALEYDEYAEGKNCIKVTGWNESGSLTTHRAEIDFDDNTDTDKDGITDSIEEHFGLDKNSSDSDQDGLSDYDEIMIYALNPLNKDSDEDGIQDAQEDADEDGLSNERESELGTDGKNGDTDEDKLSDGDEINKYGTDPLKEDTDGDGLSDGMEVEFGFNPLVAEESFMIHKASEEEDSVKVSVDIVLDGTQVESLSVGKNLNENLFPKEMPGYIGSAYDFSVDGTFEEATIQFEFEESLLADEEFDPIIYYYNEAECELEELDTIITGNVASAKVQHFSTYILINRKVNLAAYTWTDDKEVAKHHLTTEYFKSYGGTNMYQAIQSSLSLFQSESDRTLKMMIVLSDGVTSDLTKMTSAVSAANENEVKIYTIGLGNQTVYFDIYLKPLSSQTAGKYYHISDASGLDSVYDNINEMISVFVDSDNDGIPDYYEDNMVLFNGVTIKLDKYNPDTDGDGLLDGEEVQLEHKFLDLKKNKVRVTGKLKSHPLLVDSDGDGLMDNCALVYDGNEISDKYTSLYHGEVMAPKDPHPLTYDGEKNMWKGYISSLYMDPIAREYGNDEGMGDWDWLSDNAAKNIVGYLVKLDKPLTEEEYKYTVTQAVIYIRATYLLGDYGGDLINKLGVGELDELVGAYILNFIKDDKGIAYHSQPETWQRKFGYNRFYDDIFYTGSKMDTSEAIEFQVGSKTYALWMWKGDYYNMHSGGEIGLYVYRGKGADGIKLYDAIDTEYKMRLSLFQYHRYDKYGDNMENIFHWFPTEPQWWITGFNTEEQFENPWGSQHFVVVGKLELPRGMYSALKSALLSEKNDGNRDYFIFDENGTTVWVMWDEK